MIFCVRLRIAVYTRVGEREKDKKKWAREAFRKDFARFFLLVRSGLSYAVFGRLFQSDDVLRRDAMRCDQHEEEEEEEEEDSGTHNELLRARRPKTFFFSSSFAFWSCSSPSLPLVFFSCWVPGRARRDAVSVTKHPGQ